MPVVSIVFGLHQPLFLSRTFPYGRLRRIAEESSLMDKYADYGLLHRQFLENNKWVFTPAINGFLAAAEEAQKTGSSFKFSLAMSGLFIEQLLKEDTALIAGITRLVGMGAVEILATTYYNSLSSIFSGGQEEFEEQVRETQALVKKVFGFDTKVLSNTKLIYNDSVAKSAEGLGLSGVLADYVPSLGAPNYQETFSPGSSPGVRILVRNNELSMDLVRGEFDAAKLCTTGVNIIYVDSDSLPKTDSTAYRNLALSFIQRGIQTVTPSEIIESTTPAGNISVPEAVSCALFEMNGSCSSLLSNPMQRMYFERVAALRPYVKEIDDPRIKGLWRLLQQVDHLYCMDDSGTLPNPRVFSSASDAFSVCNTVLVDFEGKVGTLVQRMRKARAQVASKVPSPQLAPPSGMKAVEPIPQKPQTQRQF